LIEIVAGYHLIHSSYNAFFSHKYNNSKKPYKKIVKLTHIMLVSDMPSCGKIKVLGIACSARKNGNTELLLRTALKSAEKVKNVETEMVSLADKDIHPCDACDTCHETNVCRIEDYVTTIVEKMKMVDAIILSAPVYLHNISAQAKILMDRTNCLFTSDGDSLLRDKIGCAIVVGQERQGGKAYALMSIITFFLAHHMIVIGGTRPEGYPGVSAWTFGVTNKNAVLKDEAALSASEELGLRLAQLTKRLKRKTSSNDEMR
jgi:multimeric flavodoxin WrbA